MNATDNDVLITHIFDAPREVVFKAWTDAQSLPQWYAPDNCTVHFTKLDIREGGEYLSCIHNPEYGDCWATGVYHEIKFPEKLVYDANLADENGNLVKSSIVNKDEDWPAKTIVTITFAEENGKTKVTLHQTAPETVAKRTGAYPSWIQMFNRLEKIIANS